jgi:oligopeptide/dipeptide ABC transporter ATP-binding protein
METILEVNNLSVQFPGGSSAVRAVDGVSFRLERSRTLGVVGESGCGKSMTALAILRLVQSPGWIAAGEIWYWPQGGGREGLARRNLLELSEREMRRVRGAEIAMIFQEPMTALNPVFTIGDQIREAIQAHSPVSSREANRRTVEVMQAVAIPMPERRLHEYPHQLSGGLRQRAMIAMALAARPKLLIADEPTTALDVTIQAQILELLRRLKAEFQLSLMIISHDFGVIAEIADDVAIMYAGKLVEFGPAGDVLRRPLHPYTEGLLRSVPRWVGPENRPRRLESIPGVVPDLRQLPCGCSFQPRCKDELGLKCSQAPIALINMGPERQVRCVKYA